MKIAGTCHRFKTPLFTLFLLAGFSLSAGRVYCQDLPSEPSSQPEEVIRNLPGELVSKYSLDELRRLKELILEQSKAIEELRARLSEQQSLLRALQAAQNLPASVERSSSPMQEARTLSRALSQEGDIAEVHKASATQPSAAQQPEGGSRGRSPAAEESKDVRPMPQGAQTADDAHRKEKAPWYDKLSLRGYAQVRYNRLLETNPRLVCEQCDKSLGDNNGFFLRRTRLVLSGNVHDRVYVYLQPDLALSASSDSLNFAQLRDAYFDVALDRNKEYRLRIGQSKVPYGFENLQSSQNRLALDRNDAINSATANERDLGMYFYWAPSGTRKRFSELTSSGLKGTGDYGVFGIGIFNGQTANKPEANNSLHVVSRLSYPFQLPGGRIIEGGVQAYRGRYVISKEKRSPLTLGPDEFRDQRVALSLTVYPQPLGFQAEYNFGRGPEFNPSNNTIETRPLGGGYAQVMYRLQLGEQVLFPFFKSQYYDGGKKQELDARHYLVREHEFGLEWQPNPNFEWVGTYAISDRIFEDGKNPNNRQKGRVLRMQFQFNY